MITALLLLRLFGETHSHAAQDLVCNATPQYEAYGPYSSPEWWIGTPPTAQPYSEVDKRVLTPVPIGVHVDDDDHVSGMCNGEGACAGLRFIERPIIGMTEVEWTIVGDASRSGGFMDELGLATDANGAWITGVTNRDFILYVPPDDLACSNDDRYFTIKAIANDGAQLIPNLCDGSTIFEFDAHVWRTPQGLLCIDIAGPTITLPPPPQYVGGTDGSGLCVPFIQVQPDVDINSDPCDEVLVSLNVGVGDLRPLIADVTDTDMVRLLCGEGGTGCAGASNGDRLRDQLTYSWDIDENFSTPPPGTEILPGTDTRNVAILRIGDDVGQSGQIRVTVTISDTGTLYPDTPVNLAFIIRIYRISFINQENIPLPRESAPPAQDLNTACMFVSQEVTDQNINNPGAENWLGPIGTQPDSRVYRVEVESTVTPDIPQPTIRVSRRPAPWNHDDHADLRYDHTFVCKNANNQTTGAPPFRVLSHMRLVSNADRGQGAQSQYDGQYDDEPVTPMTGEQTIAVELGDRIRAALYVDGVFASHIELPVNAPPMGIDHDNSMQTAHVRWTLLSVQVGAVDTIGTVRRMSEDLAQVGLRCRHVSETQESMVKNMLIAFCKQAGSISGSVALTFTPEGGTPVSLTIPFAVNETSVAANSEALGREIAAKIVDSGWAVKQSRISATKWAIVVSPTQNVVFSPVLIPFGAKWDVAGWNTPHWAYKEFKDQDVVMWAMNYKDDADFVYSAPGSDTIEFFVLPLGWKYFQSQNQIGWTYDWIPSWVTSNPAVAGVSLVRQDAADQDDSAPEAFVAGHELGHQLLKRSTPPDESSVSTSLMCEVLSGPPENVSSTKRLADSDSDFKGALMREQSSTGNARPQLLFEECPRN